MTIVPLLLFCSLALVVGSLVLFVWSARQGDCHESERLCLMPLADDTSARPRPDHEAVPPTGQERPSTEHPPTEHPPTEQAQGHAN